MLNSEFFWTLKAETLNADVVCCILQYKLHDDGRDLQALSH